MTSNVGEEVGTDTVRFKSNYPKGSELRRLSNLADREFEVHLPMVSRQQLVTFTSVEALYQGFKFTRTDQFRRGGLLHGDNAVQISLPRKVRIGEVGFSGMLALSLEAGSDRFFENLAQVDGLEGIVRRPQLLQNDNGLLLLACQSLMYSQNEGARQLLLSTGTARLVEHDARGSFWSQTEDGLGQNANGQNLVLIRLQLRQGGPDRVGHFSTQLFRELERPLRGQARGTRWNEVDEFQNELLTYSKVLEKVASVGMDDGNSINRGAPGMRFGAAFDELQACLRLYCLYR